MVSRINLHDNNESELHMMVLRKKKDENTPIMCHPDKDMAFILIQGKMDIEYYNDKKEKINMGEFSQHPGTICCLIRKGTYYKMIPKTEVYYIEVNRGPFIKETHNRYL